MRDQLDELLRPTVESLGCELVLLEYSTRSKPVLLRLYIDHPDGVGVEHCEQVSRQVSAVLDVEDPLPGEFTLEVSSPGLRRPLVTAAHFQRFAGEEIKLELISPVITEEGDMRRRFRGDLQGMEGENIVMMVDGQRWELPLEALSSARVVPKF